MNRIYLDNAATSWPKPESVYRTVDTIQRNLGVPFGRGNYRQGQQVTQMVEQTRDSIARLIGAADRKLITFTYSCTDALNLAIRGLQINEGHIVTSVTEHNSVLRQLKDLEDNQTIQISRIGCDSEGFISPDDIIKAIRSTTQLVAVSHASNVTGAIQNLAPIGLRCRQLGIPFLVDAAQSMGHISVDVNQLNCDLLAASGHKGLLAPLGTGFLYYSAAIAERLRPLRLGGTGSSAGDDRQPQRIPEKFEAGNLNVPGIAGLGAGIEFLESEAGLARKNNYRELTARLTTELPAVANIRFFGPVESNRRLGVFSIATQNYSAHELSAILDSSYEIQTRSGFHCAPLMHQALRTAESGGLLRISIGWFSNQQEIERLLSALAEIG